MGYKRNKTYVLAFEDGDMAGLEVRCRSISIGKLMDIGAVVDGSARDQSSLERALEQFSSVLVDWNYEDDDGVPVPTTMESLLEQDSDFVLALIRAWTRAIQGVPAPLEQPSPDGEMEAQIPMVAL